ncbi:MAG: Actin-binding protein [Chlamydiae bacterium]|nr:Actin-binding protein [Chlamydiota bacterium]
MIPPVIEDIEKYNQMSVQMEALDREIDRVCSMIYFIDQQMRERIGLTTEIAGCKLKTLRKYLEVEPSQRDFSQLKEDLHREFRGLFYDLTVNFRSLLSVRDHYLDAGRTVALTSEKRTELDNEFGSHLQQKIKAHEEGFAVNEDTVYERMILALEEEVSRGNETYFDLLDSKAPHTYKKIQFEEDKIALLKKRRGVVAQKVDNIFIACQIGAFEYVEKSSRSFFIAKNRAEFFNQPNEQGFCPIHFAAYHSFPKLVGLLLCDGADPNVRDTAGYAALHWAAKAGDLVSVRILLGKGANSNAEGEYKRTPLHMAAFNHRPQICELLLQKGANPNSLAENGKTPLHDAVIHGDDVIAKKLLKSNKLDVTVRDDAGRTPLWYAVADGLVDLIPLIMAHPSWKNPENESDINHLKQLVIMDIRYKPDEVRGILSKYFIIAELI